MSNFVQLNNIDHKNLRVIRDHGAAYGDQEMAVMTFPQEFRSVQNEYPIFLRKNADNGRFYPVALLGLRQEENLFLKDSAWDADYIPVSVKRRPFLIGMQPGQAGKDQTRAGMMVYVDMASPRVSETQGEPVFLAHGGYSTYLESVIDMLDYIQYGNQLNEQFADALLQQQLLETIALEITLKNGEQNTLAGLYTINEEKLAALSDAAILAMHRQGFLEYIHMMLASQANVAKLIARLEAKISV